MVFINFSHKTSGFDINETNFYLKIIDFKITEDKIFFTLKGKEKLKANYYFQNEEEYLYYKDQIKYGIYIKVIGTLREPLNNTIPNTFNYKKYLNNKNIFYILDIDRIDNLYESKSVLYKIKNYFYKRIERNDETGYLKAFIMGDKDDVEIYENYQKLGVAHLFAISGMHIGLFSAVLLKILNKLGDKKKYFIVNVFLVVYGFVTGFSASVQRSLMFFCLSSINKMYKLKIPTMKVFILAILFLIIINPFIVFDVGFLYSFFTVYGILFSKDFISRGSYLSRAFKTSLICFLFSLPIALSNFYSVNFLSILYNIVYIPYVSFIVYPLSLFSFIFPVFDGLFNITIIILEVCSNYLVQIDVFNLYMSLSMFSIINYYLFLMLWLYKKIKIFVFMLLIIMLFNKLIYLFDSNGYVYFFDVGQGDSSIIISPYRKDVIMIDTGGVVSYSGDSDYNVSDNVISFLHSIGINKIDLLILSHGDYDHMGEGVNLINNVKIKNVIFNNGEFNDLELELIKALEKKNISYYQNIKELNIDDNKLYFLNREMYDNENDNSNVIYTELEGIKLLLMGDAGVDVEEKLLEKYKLNDIDILKVGHHGSKTSSSEEFIDGINPKYSIISVGKNNRYGHPNDSVLDNLEDSKIYRTDKDGSIMFKIGNDNLNIETCTP